MSATQSSVRKALADDFDTPKAVDVIMSLIHHGNCQLQPATKVTSLGRSPRPHILVIIQNCTSLIRYFMFIFRLISHRFKKVFLCLKNNGPRCPAVFGAMLSYVREIMGVFGVDLLDRKVKDQTLELMYVFLC